jgi:hypothetical protein
MGIQEVLEWLKLWPKFSSFETIVFQVSELDSNTRSNRKIQKFCSELIFGGKRAQKSGYFFEIQLFQLAFFPSENFLG